MVLELGGQDTSMAAYASRMLLSFYGSDPKMLFDGYMNADRGQAPFSRYFIATRDVPQYYGGDAAGVTVVCVNGLASLGQAERLWASYSGSVFDLPSATRVGWIEDAAQTIYDDLFLAGFRFFNRTRLVGFSIGGAIAEALYARVRAQNPTGDIDVLTFGSPRPGGASQFESLRGNECARYMNDNDPVPLLPWRLSDFPATALVYSGRQMVRFGTYVHPGYGYILAPNGNITPGNEPPATITSLPLNTASWLYGLVSGQPSGHSLAEYARRLLAYVAANPLPQQQMLGVGGGDFPDPVRREEVAREERIRVRAMFAEGEAQNEVPPQIPVEKRFIAIRQGSIWTVFFDGQPVAIGPTKRRARRVAREGNAWLRSIQVMAVVDPAGILSQMNDYFAGATDAGGGFVPVMNTEWPLA